jgi:hypothetical protein
MEIADVRRHIAEIIDRARRKAAERRARTDAAARDYGVFLDTIAVPLVRQVANVLKVQGYPFVVFTPSGSVRLASERSGDDYIELSLDTTGSEPAILGHSRRTRGQRTIDRERTLDGPVHEITEEQVLLYLLDELEPFLER